MKNTENESNRCNDCEQMFEDNVKGMVNEVDGYTHKDHRHKAEEVHEAYDTDRNRTASHEYDKPTRETESAAERHGDAKAGSKIDDLETADTHFDKRR